MGRVLIEAAACSKPRVGTLVEGIPTVIAHESDGLLVPVDDVDALAKALARLMGDAELRKQYGRAAAHRVATDLSVPAFVQNNRELARRVFAA